MGEDGRNAHAQTNGVEPGWRVVAGLFLIEDDLLHRGSALTAHGLGPGDPDIARLKFAGLPFFGIGNRFGAAAMIALRQRILVRFNPGPHLGAIGGFFWGIFKIHRLSPLCGHHRVALFQRTHKNIGPL